MSLEVREAEPAELTDWNRRVVDVVGGQVLQSLEWARHRATTGWRPHHLVVGGDRAVLALVRPWPLLGGTRVHLPRGPVTAGDPPDRVAGRVEAVAGWFAQHGADVITTDAELPVASGYGGRLRALGFISIEEIEPARHRMVLSIEGRDEERVLAGVSKATRQRIHQAEAEAIVVRRFDARADRSDGPGFEPAPAAGLPAALTAFHGLVRATAERRGFELGPLEPFLAWLIAAHAAGHAIYLEACLPGASPEVGEPLAGLLVYRQGDRLSTAISGDDAASRASHPGVLHLLRWRAIQLAIREGLGAMDLGGVDAAGARHEPRADEPLYGLYQHKRSFGAVFVEQVGAHERRLRPVHLALARATASLARRLPR